MTHRTHPGTFTSRVHLKSCGTEPLVEQCRPTLGAVSDITGQRGEQKSRCFLPSTHGPVALSAEQVSKKKKETEDTPVAMETRREPALSDTIRQTLVSRRSDRGRHNSGIEVWELMRDVGGMNKSLNTVTGMSQRGSDHIAREKRVYA